MFQKMMSLNLAIYSAALLLFVGAKDQGGRKIQIAVNQDSTSVWFGAIEVLGLPERDLKELVRLDWTPSIWRTIFAVRTGTEVVEDPALKPPMLGQYEIGGAAIRFVARFGLAAGMSYTAKCDLSRLYQTADLPMPDRFRETTLIETISLASPEVTSTTYVEQVYPTTDRLPMNQLKLYLHFSAPMRQDRASKHVKLLEQPSGREVPDAFLQFDKELWDPDRTRLTIFFDPGRIKRGLLPNLQLGLPLQEGRRYRLQVGRDWQDASGAPLVEDYLKEFEVVAVDRVSPDIDNWNLSSPKPHSKLPLIVRFSEPLDHGLLQRLLVVFDANDDPLRGEIEVRQHEKQWEFHPVNPWAEGEYTLKVDTWLEDLAGNNLRRLFDVDLKDPNYRVNNDRKLSISFLVK
jgi:hypothetical protein